jgi:hypothetical protein
MDLKTYHKTKQADETSNGSKIKIKRPYSSLPKNNDYDYRPIFKNRIVNKSPDVDVSLPPIQNQSLNISINTHQSKSPGKRDYFSIIKQDRDNLLLENENLKSDLKLLRSELISLKSDVSRCVEKKQRGDTSEFRTPDRRTKEISDLKMRTNDLQVEIRIRDEEIDKLKRTIKNNRIHEDGRGMYSKEYLVLQKNFSDLQTMLLRIQSENMSKENELKQLKEKLVETEKELNNYKLQNLRKASEGGIPDAVLNDLKFYKDLAQ